MLSQECVRELRSSWLPNITDPALRRLVELLEKNSPLLIHGAFSRAVPMGCLATQAGWNHPHTAGLNQDAGVVWLHFVAGLNPATSQVIKAWDGAGSNCYQRFAVRQALLEHFRDELRRRQETPARAERAADLVAV